MKQKNSPLILGAVLVIGSVALLFGGTFAFTALTASPEVEASALADITVDEQSFDWGEIEMKDGPVKAEFTITNSGSEELQLYDVVTSCSCTNAQLFFGDKKSPLYSMHSSSNYVMKVPPQQSARLVVEFDPAFHGPTGIGPQSRQITVKTNDADTPELTFNVNTEVTK